MVNPDDNYRIVIDPYNGYSSSPDSSREYSAYSNENQMRWLRASEETIQEFIDKLSTFHHFHEAYTFLANKRQMIAIDLQQSTDEGHAESYGSFRHEGDHLRQSISFGDGENFWKWQKNKIFELTSKIIHDMYPNTIKDNMFEDKNIICVKEKVLVENTEADYYSISIKSPFINSNIADPSANTLSVIELYDFDRDKKFNLIRIEFTPIVETRNQVYKDYLNQFYKSMLNWKRDESPHLFLENAANLAYLLSHLKFVKQGNVGIAEWMIRALAYKNDLMLGRFNHKEGISWDFKAILTPDKGEFVNWFSDKAFLDYSLLDPVNSRRKFSYLPK